MDLNSVCDELRRGSEELASHTEAQKNHALECVAAAILKNKDAIMKANVLDVADARAKGTKESLVDRLSLDEKKFKGLIDGINIVIQQTDPVGKETGGWKIPNGVQIRQVRVPLGVVAIIYESRPNVTVDAFALAYKSGNSILLRGSSSALNSNKAIVDAIKEGLEAAGKDGVASSIYLCRSGDRNEVDEILTAVGKIDVALPRGSANLINHVVQNAKVPVIQTGDGVCHLYVDESADLEMACNIAENGKIQRPGVCNALETIVVNKKIASDFLPKLVAKFADRVELRADEESYSILSKTSIAKDKLKKAEPEDFGFEFLDYICAVKTVENVDEAIAYINSHNTKHSECIVTDSRTNAQKFQLKVDAACVYVNASTRFTDGGMFGFGAELGISTQKLHARGPMGAEALTTTKFLIDGNGQVR